MEKEIPSDKSEHYHFAQGEIQGYRNARKLLLDIACEFFRRGIDQTANICRNNANEIQKLQNAVEETLRDRSEENK